MYHPNLQQQMVSETSFNICSFAERLQCVEKRLYLCHKFRNSQTEYKDKDYVTTTMKKEREREQNSVGEKSKNELEWNSEKK